MTKKNSKKPVGKVENRFSSDSFDYVREEELECNEEEEKKDEEAKQAAQTNKDETLEHYGSEGERQFQGKLRRLFVPTDAKDLIKHQAHPVEESDETGYIPEDYTYIQMKLNIEHISEEFSQELEEYRISGIQIRRATMADLEIFVKLYNRAFMRGSDPWSPATEDQFSEIMKHENTVILIASVQHEDVGFIITDLEENGEVGVICGLGVDPRWQRRGIARYLGIASWDYFRNLNVKELQCEVYEKNQPSYKLIKSLHFKEYGKKIYQF